MTCQWYEQQLANERNELWVNGRPSPALLEHTRECERCAKLADRELELRGSLLRLAESSQFLRPSENVKRNLLAALNSNTPVRPRRVFVLRLAFAAAAVLCLGIGLLYWRNARPQPVPEVAHQPETQPKQAAPQQSVPVQTVAAMPKANRNPVQVAATTKRPALQQSTVAKAQPQNDFYPVIMCDSLTCAGPTVAVRVELPASPLVNRGGGSNRTVMADLLVGEDGLVRGVRVLQ